MIHLVIRRELGETIGESVPTIAEAQSLIGAALQDRDGNPDTDKLDGDVHVIVDIIKG